MKDAYLISSELKSINLWSLLYCREWNLVSFPTERTQTEGTGEDHVVKNMWSYETVSSRIMGNIA